VQTVTPEMARFYTGTRTCWRCRGSLGVDRDNAFEGVVKCLLCGQEYLRVQFETRPRAHPRNAKVGRLRLDIVGGVRQLPWASQRTRRPPSR
jgi:hypothetical protein